MDEGGNEVTKNPYQKDTNKKQVIMRTPFKMKGSPFQRNFGIGAPLKQVKQEITTGHSNHRTQSGPTTTVTTTNANGNIHKVTTLNRTGEIMGEGGDMVLDRSSGSNTRGPNASTKTNKTKFDGTKRQEIKLNEKSKTEKVINTVKKGVSKGLGFFGARGKVLAKLVERI